MTPASDAPLRLGLIGRTHGLSGAFRVVGPAEWYAFAHGATLLVGGREHTVQSVAGTPDAPIVTLSGVTTREDAAALLGRALEMRAGDAPDFSSLEARVRETQVEVRSVFVKIVEGAA